MDLTRECTLNAALLRIAQSGLQVATTIKIGAGSAADTQYIEPHFPDSRTFLIEMDPRFEHLWISMKNRIPTLDWAICGASDEDREAFMRKGNIHGGVITKERTDDSVPVVHRRIDTLVKERDLKGPFFLRFDTHGAEMEVLAGATETLKETALIQMECYNFKHEMRFGQMVVHMEKLGFRVIDMCDPLYRKDGALWQMHLFFARDDHPRFKRLGFND